MNTYHDAVEQTQAAWWIRIYHMGRMLPDEIGTSSATFRWAFDRVPLSPSKGTVMH